MTYDTVLHYIKKHAEEQGDTLAVCEMNRAVTYAGYWELIRRTASVLASRGIKKGDHVIIRNFQNIDYLAAFSALQYIGALPIPLEKSINEERIAEVAEKVGAAAVISSKSVDGYPFIETAAVAKESGTAEPLTAELPHADDRSMMLYTTGTTGASKGIVMHHRGDVAIAGNVICGTQMKKGNVEILPMPLNHSFAVRRYQSVMVNGGTVCLMNGIVFIGVLWKMMDKYKATSLALAPAALSVIFRLSEDKLGEYGDRLDYIQLGSAPLPEAEKHRLQKLLPKTRLYNIYGSTEAGCSSVLDFSGADDTPGSIGRPTVNSAVAFMDENGNMMEKAEKETPGLMCWGGPIVMEGYYGDPEETARTVENGFVKTSDLGYMDEEGRCIMIGRADDIINSGGNKIAPVEIEEIANAFDGVMESACTGLMDELLGEVPVLVVVPERDSYDRAGLMKYLSERIEGYKLPRSIIDARELPKTFNGKLLRRKIKEQVNAVRR